MLEAVGNTGAIAERQHISVTANPKMPASTPPVCSQRLGAFGHCAEAGTSRTGCSLFGSCLRFFTWRKQVFKLKIQLFMLDACALPFTVSVTGRSATDSCSAHTLR